MPDKAITKEQLLQRIAKGWDALQSFINQYDEIQLTQNQDAAGWTAKDHIIHLAIWERGIHALLNQQSRVAAMGIDETIWKQGVDVVNDVIYKAHRHLSLADVLEQAQRQHQALIKTLSEMTDDQLRLPYQHYDPTSRKKRPVFLWVMGNTFQHYKEHQRWIVSLIAASS